jgi:DNA-binding NarL/FixJ family response regulator
MIAVAIVDDYLPALQKIVSYTEKISGVSVTYSGQYATEFIKSLTVMKQLPAIVLVDYQMSPVDGVTLIDYLSAAYPHIKTICISGVTDSTTLTEVFSAGAIGFISKIFADSHTINLAIVAAITNSVFISTAFETEFTVAEAIELRDLTISKLKNELTSKERIYSILNATCLSYKEIADIMFIEEKTVETIGYRLSRKKGIKGGRRNLMAFSIKQGWIKIAHIFSNDKFEIK